MRNLWIGVVAVLTIAGSASSSSGDPKVSALEAAYAPTAKATGPARATQLCTDEKAIEKATNALPAKPPAGAALDATAWSARRDAVLAQLLVVVDACAAPDKKVKHLNGKSETVDDLVTALDANVHEVVDSAKPRDVPADLKKLRAAIAATKPTRAACAQQKTIAKLAGALATPAKVDSARWAAGIAAIGEASAALKESACKSSPADDELSAQIDQLTHASLELVLALPPRAGA
jgi:hypothetical protein